MSLDSLDSLDVPLSVSTLLVGVSTPLVGVHTPRRRVHSLLRQAELDPVIDPILPYVAGRVWLLIKRSATVAEYNRSLQKLHAFA